MGIIIKTGFKNQDLLEEIIFFVVYLFILIATRFNFYFGFKSYKEMRYLFEQKTSWLYGIKLSRREWK